MEMRLFKERRRSSLFRCSVFCPLLAIIYIGGLQCQSFTSKQVHSLILEYFLVCGPRYVCDLQNIFSLSPIDIKKINVTSKCPPCYCDNSCMSREDCCPDFVLRFPARHCTNVTIMISSKAIEQQANKPLLYSIVDSCPDTNTNTTLQTLCAKHYSPKDRLLEPIVSAIESPVSFRNKYCALCNGFTHFKDWMLEFDCTTFVDFNVISIYESIIDEARRSDCTVKYTPGTNPAVPCNTTTTDNKIEHCNATGKWVYHNADTQTACESFSGQPYGIYKNIFCFLCNPSAKLDATIDQCNLTGMWQPFSQDLDRACRYFGLTMGTQPFKNIFCFLCNKKATARDDFHDVSLRIKPTSTLHGNPVRYVRHLYQVKKFNTDYYLKVVPPHTPILSAPGIFGNIQDYHNAINPFDSAGIFEWEGQSVNLTALMYLSLAVVPENQYCRKDLLPPKYIVYHHYLDSCSCQPNCIFNTDTFRSKCCMDSTLTHTTACITNEFPVTSIPCKPLLHEHARQNMSSTILTFKKSSNVNKRIVSKAKSKSYTVVNGCRNLAGQFHHIRVKCNQNANNDIFDMLPLTSSSDGTQYRSFHCAVCNCERTHNHILRHVLRRFMKKYYAWRIEITCQQIMSFEYLLLLSDVIKLAHKSKCSVHFIPNNYTVEFNRQKSLPIKECQSSGEVGVTSFCNMTGQWTGNKLDVNWSRNEGDVRWACECLANTNLPRYGQYKNVFCYICNPQKSEAVFTLISTCNTTGAWIEYDETIVKACETFPTIAAMFPYKNWYCKACNVNFDELDVQKTRPVKKYIQPVTETPKKDDNPNIKFYKSIATTGVHHRVNNKLHCFGSVNSSSNKGMCRPVLCFPGKILTNDGCRPLLATSNNLRYTLSVALSLTHPAIIDKHFKVLSVIFTVERTLTQILKQISNITSIHVDDITILANVPCEITGEKSLELYVQFTVLLQDKVDRMKLEEGMLIQYFSYFNVTYRDKVLTFTGRQSLEAMQVKSIIEKMGHRSHCFIQRNQYARFTPGTYHHPMFVSQILMCEHIQFEQHEYIFHARRMTAVLLNLHKNFSLGEFHLLGGGQLRVCTDQMKGLLPSALASNSNKLTSDDLHQILDYATLACTVISLLCLLATFLAYSAFSTLRSLTGVNDMCLILTSFCIQVCLQLRLNLHAMISHVMCCLVGTLTHGFSIALFTCLLVGNFHMYHVFPCSRVPVTHFIVSIRSKRLWLYLSFCFLVPVLIASANVIAMVIVNDGTIESCFDKMCFISNRTSYIASVIVPIASLFCLNTYFIIAIPLRINRSKTDQTENEHSIVDLKCDTKLKRDFTHQYIAYIVVFALMIISAVFEIANSFHSLTMVMPAVVISNAAQGLVLSLRVLLREQVRNMYMDKACCRHVDNSYCPSSEVGSQKDSTDLRCNSIQSADTTLSH